MSNFDIFVEDLVLKGVRERDVYAVTDAVDKGYSKDEIHSMYPRIGDSELKIVLDSYAKLRSTEE